MTAAPPPATECELIEWEKKHTLDNKPCCPRCGQEAVLIRGSFFNPCWAHKRTTDPAKIVGVQRKKSFRKSIRKEIEENEEVKPLLEYYIALERKENQDQKGIEASKI